MKKKAGIWLLTGLLLSQHIVARADTFYGDPGWRVAFTEGREMESNFKTSDLDETIYGMQPGDDVEIRLGLTNQNSVTTDWYMTNKVLYSLEDRSQNRETSGGAYTYQLYYTNAEGTVTVLFDNDTIGGDTSGAAGEGLHEATNALQDYFYLDTLQKGEQGSITLRVALDGETQNNGYQDTLADLQMNFAVELTDVPGESDSDRSGSPVQSVRPVRSVRSNIVRMNGVQTGDMSKPLLYAGLSLAAGLGLLLTGLCCRRRLQREQKEEKG